jgi:adenine-specific DNA methylase/REP element-mobilizing transposase RayT
MPNGFYKTYAVVIMPDHVHWLMQPFPKSEKEYWSLSSILQSIKSYSSKQIGKAINHIGTLWQDEYYDRIIRDDREFLETWKYIRDNPVKANLADYPENYPFFWQAKSLDLKDLNHSLGQTSSLPNISKKNDSSNSDLSWLTINDDIGWQDASPTKVNDTNFRNNKSTIINININLESADSLYHISNNSLDVVITDPPYYGTIPYADISDFFYVWQKRVLGDIFPDLFWQELTDKDREAIANPSRFRNMGESPDELAKRDYEAKMALAWSEAYRVLRDEGVLTVQFNHKDSGAWDVLAKALIDAGFEITASWAVSTENPQNLHQANKNSVSSTVILVCRKRDRNAEQAWWDDLRPEVANLVEQRAPEFEANDITGIDLYLSAFGPALNVFSRSYPILDSSGDEVRPDVAFAEARKAIANYRFRKLVQSDTVGFDPLTQWYLLAWDAFKAREFPFDEARQLALAIGGFNVNDLAKTYKLLDSTSGSCAILTPQQRLKKRAFTTNPQEFTATYLVDALHAAIAIYEEESSIQQVRQFMQKTGLMSNDLFMKTLEVAFRVIPDKAKEKDSLVNLWLGIDEIKAKVVYQQTKLF